MGVNFAREPEGRLASSSEEEKEKEEEQKVQEAVLVATATVVKFLASASR